MEKPGHCKANNLSQRQVAELGKKLKKPWLLVLPRHALWWEDGSSTSFFMYLVWRNQGSINFTPFPPSTIGYTEEHPSIEMRVFRYPSKQTWSVKGHQVGYWETYLAGKGNSHSGQSWGMDWVCIQERCKIYCLPGIKKQEIQAFISLLIWVIK